MSSKKKLGEATGMKIFLHELNELGTELQFTDQVPWIKTAVLKVDETAQETGKPLKAFPIAVEMELSKVDEVVVINGRIETTLNLNCSRCASPFEHGIQTRFSGLFCQDPEMAGVGYLNERSGKPAGINKGFARHAHDAPVEGEDETGVRPDEWAPTTTSRDLDITYISEDFIELSEVLTEQLQLAVPFQPLCKNTCKGMCFTCGTDLNHGKCACAQLTKESPFSLLKDFQVKSPTVG